MQNKGMTKEDEASDEEDESEETLTPGDLMAFAWQISEGMVRRLFCYDLSVRHYFPYQEPSERSKTEFPDLNFTKKHSKSLQFALTI